MMQHPIAFGFDDCPGCNQPMHVRTIVDGPDTILEEQCATCDHRDTYIIDPDEQEDIEPDCPA